MKGIRIKGKGQEDEATPPEAQCRTCGHDHFGECDEVVGYHKGTVYECSCEEWIPPASLLRAAA